MWVALEERKAKRRKTGWQCSNLNVRKFGGVEKKESTLFRGNTLQLDLSSNLGLGLNFFIYKIGVIMYTSINEKM